MAESNPKQSSSAQRQDAADVVRRLRDAGHVAYFAGGCVRDMLLGIEPKDYDVATDAPPDRVRQLFPNTQAVGAAFGVILVRQRKSPIEVATFRTDGKYLDGRRPETVVFTTAEEDAKRRDFTINGIFYDPIEQKVIDYVGGQKDVKNRLLRAIGEPNHRFEEDHLRLLRAVRFAARFELEIEPITAGAIEAHASHLKRISPERIAEELRRMLTLPAQGGDWAWFALFNLFPGLSDVIFRYMGDLPAAEGRKGTIFDALPEERKFGLALAAASLEWLMGQTISADVTTLLSRQSIQKMVQALRQSLRISNEESDDMFGSLEGVAILLQNHPLRIAMAKRFLARPSASLSRALLRALTCHVGQHQVEAIDRQLHELSKTDFAPTPLITGDDLTAAGWKPGPKFKQVLDEVYDAQLEGRVATKDQAMELARSLAKP